MAFDLLSDSDYQLIHREVESGDLLRDAWFVDKNGEERYPARVKKAFQVKPDYNRRGADIYSNYALNDFINLLAERSPASTEAVRCKVSNKKNAKPIRALVFSPRLERLVSLVRSAAVSSIPAPSAIPKTTADGDPMSIRKSQEAGFESDPAARKVIELYAVECAQKFYEGQGYSVHVEGTPFDLLCEKGSEVVHVEVKGSRGLVDAVELTVNEVSDARAPDWRSDLFVVDRISLDTSDPDNYKASGGRCRRAEYWEPADEHLIPSRYRYSLPSGMAICADEHSGEFACP